MGRRRRRRRLSAFAAETEGPICHALVGPARAGGFPFRAGRGPLSSPPPADPAGRRRKRRGGRGGERGQGPWARGLQAQPGRQPRGRQHPDELPALTHRRRASARADRGQHCAAAGPLGVASVRRRGRARKGLRGDPRVAAEGSAEGLRRRGAGSSSGGAVSSAGGKRGGGHRCSDAGRCARGELGHARARPLRRAAPPCRGPVLPLLERRGCAVPERRDRRLYRERRLRARPLAPRLIPAPQRPARRPGSGGGRRAASGRRRALGPFLGGGAVDQGLHREQHRAAAGPPRVAAVRGRVRSGKGVRGPPRDAARRLGPAVAAMLCGAYGALACGGGAQGRGSRSFVSRP
mmetsp:Transcript_11851/g.28119  ORF Transcript_11851/g.28119 Transcript_11851/m.28119 type:complete len:349 (+) Transcript_11851:4176-5222(+)